MDEWTCYFCGSLKNKTHSFNHYSLYGRLRDIIPKFDLGTMTSSNGNLFPVTDPLCGEFTGHWCVPFTKASDVELWCFLWSTPDQAISNISFIWFEWIWCLTQRVLTLLRKPNQSSNGNIFRITGPLCGHRWIPLSNASDAELWCFLWSVPE